MRTYSIRGTALCGLAAGVLALCPAIAFGKDPAPSLKGKWVGKTNSIVAGKGGHWPSGTGSFEKPALVEKDLVIEITGQEGRRFWGVTTISGGGEKTDEPFVGQLTGDDNETVFMADTDGYVTGQVDDDLMSLCYLQAGGKTQSAVVSCTEVKRTP